MQPTIVCFNYGKSEQSSSAPDSRNFIHFNHYMHVIIALSQLRNDIYSLQ